MDMKKIISEIMTAFGLMAMLICIGSSSSYAMVKDVYSTNYLTYEKTYADMYGYNKGE